MSRPGPNIDGFCDRLDAKLAEFITDEGRRRCLERQLYAWQWRYREWQARVDNGCPTDPRIDASDFIITIAEIDKRLGRYREAA